MDPPRSRYQKYVWSRWGTGEIIASQVILSQWNRGGSAVGMKACQKGAELNLNHLILKKDNSKIVLITKKTSLFRYIIAKTPNWFTSNSFDNCPISLVCLISV